MARNIAPTVISTELDLSFLPNGTAQAGAAFVGPTLEGPAFIPTVVNSQNDFEALFGTTSPNFYTPYAVQSYLSEAQSAVVCRILGLSGYDNTLIQSLILSLNSASVSVPIAVLFPSQNGLTLPTGSIGSQTSPTQFTLNISSSDGLVQFTSMSIDPNSKNYIGKVLGTTAGTKTDAFVTLAFPAATEFCSGSLAGSGSISLAIQSTQLMLSGSVYGTYREAITPWIRSQILGSIRSNLFRFHTRSDGTNSNTKVKISVANIAPDPLGQTYGTFSILVRDFEDTDANPNVLEQFDELNINTTDANYIGRRIGTARPIIDSNGSIYLEGDFPNNSRYVFVEADENIQHVDSSALPYGFTPLASPLNEALVHAPSYIATRYATPTGATTPVANNKTYYGFNFADDTSIAYLSPIPSGSINAAGSVLVVGQYPSGDAYLPAGGADPGFDLLTNLATLDSVDILPNNATALRKFTVPFQNGFDGTNPAAILATGGNITETNTQGFDLSDASKDGSRAYNIALTALSNMDLVSMNMLVLPGVIYSLHPYITTQAINVCENRGDAFYILDGSALGQTVNGAVNDVADLDTNYAGTYYPWIKVLDNNTNQVLWAPPSVVLPQSFAFNDRVGAPWFAPAGLNRGELGSAIDIRTVTNQDDRDSLYEGRVNPIAKFPGSGIVTWGQKTLQQLASALDRINVRRLLIEIKTTLGTYSKSVLFEQNTAATQNRVLAFFNQYLQSVQQRSGLFAFQVQIITDDPSLIDRNILAINIFLQPARDIETIKLNFIITPTGTSITGG